MRTPLTLVCLFLSFCIHAQKVGLVMSGGAAKGIAHVGVLKALEEHDIPIDYIVGTSMGGIIAGCYAAGMSPDEIDHMMTSDKFLSWVNGKAEEGFNYYYHRSHDDPHFIKLNLSLDSILNVQFNTFLAQDVTLNFALTEKMAQASAISNGNFDSLFIPLRVVAADVFTQNEVILRKGSLSDALRATQTVPFFYTPVRVDGKYLFDGGIYNNFPVSVMQAEFSPEIIIGSNVSAKVFDEYPYDNDDKLIRSSLLYMLLDKSDPSSIPESGIYIQPNLKGYSSFDFSSARALIDSGYIQTLRQIEDIKQKVEARRPCEETSEKRNQFNNRNRPLMFDGVVFQNFNSRQRVYLQRIFKINTDKQQSLSLSDIKKGYFKLVSEEYFSNVYPRIFFNNETDKFSLELTRRPQKNFQVDFGGVIATRDISNIFIGTNFYHFNRTLLHVSAGFQTGNFYRSAVVRTRVDYPLFNQFYIEPEFVYNSYNYIESSDLLRTVNSTVLRRSDRRLGLNVGWPLGTRFKTVIRAAGFNGLDTYGNNYVFVSTDTLDQQRLAGGLGELNISSNTLNRKQYATAGRLFSLSVNYYTMRNRYTPGNTSWLEQSSKTHYEWARLRLHAEQYFNKGWYRTGYLLQAVMTNQPTFQNYVGTLIVAPAFNPLPDSPTLILENFRAFNYVAGGIRNIFSLRNKLDLRLEGFAFKPLDYLRQGGEQQVVFDRELKQISLAGNASLVMHSPIGPISLSVNYYDDKQNQLGVLLHVGYLLFNKHSLE